LLKFKENKKRFWQSEFEFMPFAAACPQINLKSIKMPKSGLDFLKVGTYHP